MPPEPLQGPPDPERDPPFGVEGSLTRIPATWRWWEAVALFALVLLVGAVLGAGVIAVVPGDDYETLATTAVFDLCLGGGTLLWIYSLHRPAAGAIGVPQRPLLEVMAGIVGGLALRASLLVTVPLVTSLLRLVTDRQPEPPEQLPSGLSGGEIAVAVVTVVILAPVAEELFYRAFLFRSLRERHGLVFAGGISALVFGASHIQGLDSGSVLLASVLVVVGFGLAYVYDRRANILAPIVAHATFNAIGLSLLLLL
jgi:CAAX protease family protein